jgi:hypothetical protein
MRLDHYLEINGLEKCAFFSEVARRLHIEGKDALWVTGSLVEDLGSRFSDVDFYLITERDLSNQLVFTNTIISQVSDVVIDVEVHAPEKIRSLIERLSAFPYDEDRDFRKSLVFSQGDLKLLHNLSKSDFAAAGPHRAPLEFRIDERGLARILFDRSLAHVNSLHSDILGAFTEGDLRTLGPLLNGYYWHLAALLLASHSFTNPGEKWRARNLERLKSMNGAYGLPAYSHSTCVKLFDGGAPTCAPRLSAQHDLFQRLAHAGNIIIPLGQERFLSGKSEAEITPDDATFAAEPRRHRRNAQAGLPGLNKQTVIRYDRNGFRLGNLGKRKAHYLNRRGFDILTQFDGTTDFRCAVSRLEAELKLSRSEITSHIQTFHTFLRDAGYL